MIFSISIKNIFSDYANNKIKIQSYIWLIRNKKNLDVKARKNLFIL